ncbi:MAG: GNAT family N-acetyltransferase [Lachnospiraceae bacterium]|nr:GNAT family N-acetyltransferase [Lachnospiraceae bacterium]
MKYSIRAIKNDEYTLLNEFLYEAIFIPEGVQAPPKSIINLPELQVYVSNFGKKKDDICFVAEVEENIVGAVWVRVMNDYGHVEDGVPSFAISLYKEYRGCGIGTALMKRMLQELLQRGYEKASLAVQKANYAVKMYQKVGFEVVGENEEEFIMICNMDRISEETEHEF